MTLHVHDLTGCSPTPLAFYLKALGVLRLVAEQIDSTARGWWRDECFHLATRLSRDELTEFFLKAYAPTPLVAPWNGGSGFYPKDNKNGIKPIAASMAQRFEVYRSAIDECRRLVGRAKASPKDEDKQAMLRECRRTWRGPTLAWLEAALVLIDTGEPAYPALLGTGGNDGRLDFTNNFMQRLGELFDCESAEGEPRLETSALLGAAMFHARQPGLQASAIGQFFPGAAGGANSSVGFVGDSLVNPWDFVLMLEGAILFASAVTRRMTTDSLPQAAAPFAVYASAAGFASATEGEKNRGEQWMPLWSQPATCRELTALISEGRCQVQDRPAQRPLDVARAIARLGVARGITAFERYAYIERNGQANLATPLGRWSVPDRPAPNRELLDQIAPWVDALRRAGNDKNAPAAIGRAARRCEDAMMSCCRDANRADRWQALLIALGEAERLMTCSPRSTGKTKLQPLAAYDGGLSPGWLLAAGDGSPELRLALAFASQHGIRVSRERDRSEPDRGDPIRRHFLPLDEPQRGRDAVWRPRKFAVAGEQLCFDADVVCVANDFGRDAIALMRRRIITAHRDLADYFPMIPASAVASSLQDIHAFLDDDVDCSRLLALARPLMALDWTAFSQKTDEVRERLGFPDRRAEREAAGSLALFGLLRLCHHWEPVPVPTPKQEPIRGESGDEAAWLDRPIRVEPAIHQRLAAGDLRSAVQLAVRRARASGLRAHLTDAVGDAALARRLAAALAFPIDRWQTSLFAARLFRPTVERETVAGSPT